ncbi:MAG: caspase family protein [Rhizobiaceae bacterium]
MLRLVLAAIVWAILSTAALAERRVALVFGADDYRAIRPLENAVNDARAIEQALDALGFEVFSEADRDLRRMRRTLGNLAGALAAYETGLAIARRLAARDPGNAEWQRDLIVSHFKLAQAGADARTHLGKALAITLAMERNGILAPSDAWIPGMLRAEIAKLEPIAAE